MPKLCQAVDLALRAEEKAIDYEEDDPLLVPTNVAVMQHYLALLNNENCGFLTLLEKGHFSKMALTALQPAPPEQTEPAYLKEKKNCQELIEGLSDAYLIVLPKLMGCLICQLGHTIWGSPSYEHFTRRKLQLEQLKEMLANECFDPSRVLQFIENEMCPFKGQFGRNFYQQCKIALDNFIQQWK